MRNLLVVLAVLFALCSARLVAADVADPKDETIVKVDTAVMSKYLDRSIVRNDDTVMLSDVRIEHKNFGLEFRGEADLTDERAISGEVGNINLQLDYTFHFKKAAVMVGFDYLTYPNLTNKSTEEVFAKLSYELPMGFTPYVGMWYDIDEVNGVYTEAGINHVFDFSNKFKSAKLDSLKLLSHANLGYGSNNYNKYYFGVDDIGCQMLKIGTGLEVGFLKRWTLTPSVEYYYMTDDKLYQAASHIDDSSATGWVYGLNLGCKF